jgi:hypothetical protein
MTTARRPPAAACLAALLAAGGCGGEPGPEFGTVSGRVVVKGQPAAKVRVEFHPDTDAKTTGPSSVGETDGDGRYTLGYATKARTGAGAVVGRHRVVLQDLRMAESETGQGVPVRFGKDYSSVLSTPLSFEVKAGEQTIDIPVP